MAKQIEFFKKVLLIILIYFSIIKGDISCKGLFKQDVPYFIIQSMPYKVQAKEKIFFGYTDDQNKRSQFDYSQQDLVFDSSSPIATIFSEINKDNNIKFAQWDDSAGQSTVSSFSKGLLAISEETYNGIFFGYSMNNFLRIDKNKISMNLRKENSIYSQQFFCLSLDQQNLEKLVHNLSITKLRIQFSNLSQLKNQKLSRFQYDLNLHYPLDYKTVDLNLRDSQLAIKVITQNYWIYYNTNIPSDFETITIDDQISSILNCDILFKNSKPSVNQCQPHYTSETIQNINYKNHQLNYKYDKSKWIICKNNTKLANPFVCLSDLDNYTPRYFHGGNIFCFQSNQLHSLFSNLISSVSECSLSDIINSKKDRKFKFSFNDDNDDDEEDKQEDKKEVKEEIKESNNKQFESI